ncbi:hypothetical protein V7S43_011114 [Phytophthora oleae]|uniref:Uncharacterized protein n=1 Tax=Phytophthora oleae TaxID=2107226 RepID=A0ABD3FDY2_9STRA
MNHSHDRSRAPVTATTKITSNQHFQIILLPLTTPMVRSFATACAFVGALAVAAAQPSFVYKFDAADAAGVDGSIQIQYAGENSSIATITAALDFSRVNQSDIVAFDNNCTMDTVTSWKWHIHTKWNSTRSSDSFKQCAKAATASHFDPLRACGPVSEYNAEPECEAKIKDYACNPDNYAADPLKCEKGDLSGKFGAFKLAEDATVSNQWTDEHFPLPSENTESWSIVLHAVCGQESRIACAHRTEVEGEVDQTPVSSVQSTVPPAGCGV